MSTYPASRKQNGNLLQLEQMTDEQLNAVLEDYSLSQEGNIPEKVARIRDYEFKAGKTIQPYDQQTSQTSTKTEGKTMTIQKTDASSKEPNKQNVNKLTTNPITGESLPGKLENDAAYNEANTVAPADTQDDRNDRFGRNPEYAGKGTGPEADKARKAEAESKTK